MEFTYFKIYLMTLMSYLLFNVIWIEASRTMGRITKMTATGVCMLVCLLAAVLLIKPFWEALLVLPLSIFLWAFIVDGVTGLWFHSDFFYMSRNTWPDKQVLIIVNNGALYYFFKVIAILVVAGLLHYLSN